MNSPVVKLKFRKEKKNYIIITSSVIIFNLNFLIQISNFAQYQFNNKKLLILINFYVNFHEKKINK